MTQAFSNTITPNIGPVQLEPVDKTRRGDRLAVPRKVFSSTIAPNRTETPDMANNSTAPVFRMAAATDRPVLGAMIREYYVYDGHDIDDTIIESSLDGALVENHHIRIWIIEIEGATAGYLAVAIGFTIEAGGKDGFLDELYLRVAFRGRGIGRQAVEFAIAACPSLGIRRLSLEVERPNTRAKRLYEDIGFTAHDRILMSHWIKGSEEA